MKAYRGRRGIAPLILNVGAVWRSFTPGKEHSAHSIGGYEGLTGGLRELVRLSCAACGTHKYAVWAETRVCGY
jgi:hypothetical protein